MMSPALATVAMVAMVASVYGDVPRAPLWKKGTNGFTSDQKAAIVAKHNEYRNLEQASDMNQLTWSSSLAASSQAMADTCAMVHTVGGSYGENIAAGMGSSFRVDSFVKSWWSEIKDYTHSTKKCKDGKACGHYTQVVWAKTTKVGCGVKFCDQLTRPVWSNSYIVFCQYDPPGNYNGRDPFTCNSAGGCDYVAPTVVVKMVMPAEVCKKRDIAAKPCSVQAQGCKYVYCNDGTGCMGAGGDMAGIPCDVGKICIADKDDVMQCQDDPTDESNTLSPKAGCLFGGDQYDWCSTWKAACATYPSSCCDSCP